MILEFPGTKGEIEESSPRHNYHSSLIVREENTDLLIDFGAKHNPGLSKIINSFNFILITHAHPDHYIWTLEEENSITAPVYMTPETFNYGKNKPSNHRIIKSGKEYILNDLKITAYEVMHSIKCPAVAYKIKGDKTIIYAPDILDFNEDKGILLRDIDLMIADGSSLNINMARRKDDKLFGHTMIKTIIGWCKKYNVKNLIITHCGKQVVTMKEDELMEKIKEYSGELVSVRVAYDGLKLKL